MLVVDRKPGQVEVGADPIVEDELSQAYEALREHSPELAEAIAVVEELFPPGNESIAGRLSEQVSQNALLQKHIVDWLIQSPERLSALVKDWPDKQEAEAFLETHCPQTDSRISNFLPGSLVFKFFKPESGTWNPEWGFRTGDATCLYQADLGDGLYFYIQENLEMCNERALLSKDYEYTDGAATLQCGYNQFGQIRLADYSATGRKGSGDEVLRNPNDVANDFDEFHFRDDLQRSVSEVENFSFDPDLDDIFFSEMEKVIAADLLSYWSGNKVSSEALEQEIIIVHLIHDMDTDSAREIVHSVYNTLQSAQEDALSRY